MKKHAKIIIMLGTMLILGLAMAALWGRVSSKVFSIETAAMVLFSVSFIFGADVSENSAQGIFTSVAAVGIPVLLTCIIVRAGNYFGYSAGKIVSAAFVCGAIIAAFVLLTRHETGPLRAALGRCMLSSFFLMAGLSRLIPFFRSMGGFRIDMGSKLCFDGVLFVVFAIVVFIVGNRGHFSDLNTYLALVIWCGAFAAILWAGGHFDKKLIPILFR